MTDFTSINFSQKMAIELVLICLNICAKSELRKETGKNTLDIKQLLAVGPSAVYSLTNVPGFL